MPEEKAQNEYRVTWTIDVSSGDPLTAAYTALAMQRDTNSTAQVFSVRQMDSGKEATFDLCEATPPKACPHCRSVDLRFRGEILLRSLDTEPRYIHEWECQNDECGRTFWS